MRALLVRRLEKAGLTWNDRRHASGALWRHGEGEHGGYIIEGGQAHGFHTWHYKERLSAARPISGPHSSLAQAKASAEKHHADLAAGGEPLAKVAVRAYTRAGPTGSPIYVGQHFDRRAGAILQSHVQHRTPGQLPRPQAGAIALTLPPLARTPSLGDLLRGTPRGYQAVADASTHLLREQVEGNKKLGLTWDKVKGAATHVLGELREKLDLKATVQGLKELGKQHGPAFLAYAVAIEVFEDVVMPAFLTAIGKPYLIPVALAVHTEPVMYPLYFGIARLMKKRAMSRAEFAKAMVDLELLKARRVLALRKQFGSTVQPFHGWLSPTGERITGNGEHADIAKAHLRAHPELNKPELGLSPFRLLMHHGYARVTNNQRGTSVDTGPAKPSRRVREAVEDFHHEAPDRQFYWTHDNGSAPPGSGSDHGSFVRYHQGKRLSKARRVKAYTRGRPQGQLGLPIFVAEHSDPRPAARPRPGTAPKGARVEAQPALSFEEPPLSPGEKNIRRHGIVPDPDPGERGGFYVSIIDADQRGGIKQYGLLAGPFWTHEEAKSHVDAARRLALEVGPPATHWAAFGTARIKDPNLRIVGKLNERLGLPTTLPPSNMPPGDVLPLSPTAYEEKRREQAPALQWQSIQGGNAEGATTPYGKYHLQQGTLTYKGKLDMPRRLGAWETAPAKAAAEAHARQVAATMAKLPFDPDVVMGSIPDEELEPQRQAVYDYAYKREFVRPGGYLDFPQYEWDDPRSEEIRQIENYLGRLNAERSRRHRDKIVAARREKKAAAEQTPEAWFKAKAHLDAMDAASQDPNLTAKQELDRRVYLRTRHSRLPMIFNPDRPVANQTDEELEAEKQSLVHYGAGAFSNEASADARASAESIAWLEPRRKRLGHIITEQRKRKKAARTKRNTTGGPPR